MGKRKRRSFTHWINRYGTFPDAFDPKILERWYNLLRYGQLESTRRKAAEKLILHHIRLGAAKVASFVAIRPYESDALMSEMLCTLALAMPKLEKGAIDHHNGTPNVTGYLVVNINRRLLRYMYGQSEVTFGDSKKAIISKSHNSKLEFDEIVEKIIINDRDKQILEMRLEGFSDPEIGEKLGVTKQAIGAIRRRWQKRYLELFGQ